MIAESMIFFMLGLLVGLGIGTSLLIREINQHIKTLEEISDKLDKIFAEGEP